MIKKVLFIIILLIIASGTVFAQAESYSYRNTLAITFGIVGVEGSYELMLGNHFSLLLSGFYTIKPFIDEAGAALKTRIYPLNGIFHIDLGLGYIYGQGYIGGAVDMFLFISFIGWFIDHEFFNQEGGLLIQPSLGWKIPVGRNKNLMIPVDLGVDLRISKNFDFWTYIRVGFGYSF